MYLSKLNNNSKCFNSTNIEVTRCLYKLEPSNQILCYVSSNILVFDYMCVCTTILYCVLYTIILYCVLYITHIVDHCFWFSTVFISHIWWSQYFYTINYMTHAHEKVKYQKYIKCICCCNNNISFVTIDQVSKNNVAKQNVGQQTSM